ncbi:NgoFVII family restriction endonuclease [Paeniclostridium sordellii]|uniref:NgoFVII family restriction endonuclease n=1 Tax=Paraclostridium sordellii TaxID=1505 RepID=UPI00096A38DE|nr:NgoFVII family restriction endonuclease [Paeniclostridium sordellii]MBX9180163.1 NgoFVII family restriction endonuclease [Paeniclostridium sordellii]MVO71502.1 NgoFVII family restriction endonuclease [Paeniclostridium sordellii]
MEEFIYLPLYSRQGGIHVQERSGLNQWNANGRSRNSYEVYIPIPREVHNRYPGFFPDRDHPFRLQLPDGSIISAKICQEGEKALMSNPNSDLGRWIIPQIESGSYELIDNQNTLITYQMLESAGIDSVRITKECDNLYTIDIAPLHSYEIQMGRG